MGFHDREYEVRVALSDPTAVPPWVECVWANIATALEPLIQSARDKPAVRTTQLSIGPGSPNQRAISFGRIGWNKLGASKWTHKEDGQLLSGDLAQFLTCEAWAPSWTVCEREGKPPDVFFAISNDGRTGDPSKQNGSSRYRSTCILAVARDTMTNTRDQTDTAFSGLTLALPSVLGAGCTRPWGMPFGNGFATNVIQHLTMGGLFIPGPRHNQPASLAMLKGNWQAA